jgi:hypothetical protein
MAAYQFLNPAPILFVINGTRPAAGGTLSFFDEGTTNERDTWSDPDLASPAHLNVNPIILDAAGRSPVAIWLDGDYTIVLRDSLGDEVWSRVVRSDVPTGLSIPALAPGFLTNDLSNLLWQDIEASLLPDQTGSATYLLSTDGANAFWTPAPTMPTPPTPDIAVTATTFRAAQGATSFYVQSGTATAPNVGGRTTTVSVVYATSFVALFGAPVITPTGSSYSASANQPSWTLTSSSVTGFTVKFTMGELDDGNAVWNFNATVPFGYVAFGTIATPA